MKNNFQHQNEIVSSRKVLNINSGNQIDFPPKDKRVMTIFWATWCGPCKIEMNRLKSSVDTGSIPKDAIYAINPFETGAKVSAFIKENSYPFTFLESTIGNELGVTVTPTTLYINDGKVESMSSGMSIWGIWKAELYL